MAESFDITEPLTKRLRGLLREYPPGTTVLRELLQNADDAGAHKIVPPPNPPFHTL
jgi:sacsin